MFNLIERNFIWIIVIFSIAALLFPPLFTWLKPFISLLLGVIMFGIGFTLNINKFQTTWENKWIAIIAIIVKFTVIPLVAYSIGSTLHLSLLELIGIVIIGSSPGGTAANVMSYLSKANIALTVILTFLTTLVAPVITPALVYLYFHKHITIEFLEILNSMITIILIPIVIGIFLKNVFVRRIEPIIKIFPIVSIICIALVIACVMSLSQHRILAYPVTIIFAVTTLNLGGYFIGWITSKLLGSNKADQKAIIFEYGMFDTGLSVVIATSFFGPLAALPGALLSIIQNLTAAVLVKFMNKTTALTPNSKSLTK